MIPPSDNDTLNEVMMIAEQSKENPKTKRVPITSIPLASANEYVPQKTNQKPGPPNNNYSGMNGTAKFTAKVIKGIKCYICWVLVEIFCSLVLTD